MLKSYISPSMMCVNFLNIKEDIEALNEAKVEYLHIDIMDGVFVPNITLSNDVAKSFRKVTDIPFDYHLMIVNPEDKINWFDLRENDLMSFHIEATKNPSKCIELIKNKNAKVGIAVSPDTDISEVYPFINEIDFVLIMSVYPGFAGQKLIPSTLEKIVELKNYLSRNDLKELPVEIDGNVSLENATIMRSKGADIFVGGTSAIFKKDITIINGVNNLRSAIKAGE